MRMKLWICLAAALCLMAGMATASTLVSLDGKTVKPGGPIEPNKGLLDCSGAVEIALNNTYAGDTTGLPNNVSTYGCSSWVESGGEYVFHLYLPTPKKWTASVTASCDLDIAVLDACDEGAANCLIVVDSGVSTNVPVSGDFFFVIDGYGGAACPFTFTITELPLADFCALAMPLECADAALSGDTTDGQNLIPNPGCTGYSAAGREDYYMITLLPGGNFAAEVTFPAKDAAIYVLDGCAEPFTCLVGADDTVTGQPELVAWSNDTQDVMVYYLVIDSYGTNSYGAYNGTFVCTQGTIPTDMSSWGATKAMYR